MSHLLCIETVIQPRRNIVQQPCISPAQPVQLIRLLGYHALDRSFRTIERFFIQRIRPMGRSRKQKSTFLQAYDQKAFPVLRHPIIRCVNDTVEQLVSRRRKFVQYLLPCRPILRPHNPVNIFKQESPGRQLLQQSDILPKEPPSCIRGPRHTIGSSPRSTERLAGRPADNKINSAEFPSGQRPDIHAADPRMVKTPSRPSIQCECIAEFCLDLHRANDVKSGIRKTNIQAPRPRKQAQCSDLRDMAVFQPFFDRRPKLVRPSGRIIFTPQAVTDRAKGFIMIYHREHLHLLHKPS